MTRTLRAAAAALLLAGAAWAADGKAGLEKPHPWIGRDAPSFRSKTLDGEKFSSDSLRGRWAVLMFGASWCPYTNGKAADLQTVYPAYSAKDVQFVSVNVAEPPAKVEKWAARRAVPCPVVVDPKGKISSLYVPPEFAPDFKPRHELALASVFVIDPAGKIRFVDYCGPEGCLTKDLSRVTAALDSLMADAD